MDRCLALAFPAPASFTGEDCAELHLHGSPGILRAALERCVLMGARPALPGEFSFRAFLGGKLSILQAEATDALTACETGAQAQRFSPGAASALEAEVRRLAKGVGELEAQMEACVDFPEEVAGPEGLPALMAALEVELSALAEAGLRSRPLREGWTVALVGAPNAGKSSLFNALLRRERAIVSPHPGTTRDVLAETLDVGGLPLTLLDTAGSREPSDPLERLGVEAAAAAASGADAVLVVGRPMGPSWNPAPPLPWPSWPTKPTCQPTGPAPLPRERPASGRAPWMAPAWAPSWFSWRGGWRKPCSATAPCP
jgi:tRNA modification GTPase